MNGFGLQKAIGMVIAFLGVVVLLFFSGSPNAQLPDNHLLGDALVLLNALAFSWFLVGSKPMLSKYAAFPFMAYCYIISASVFSGIYLTQHQLQFGNLGLAFLQRMTWQEWLLIGYAVLFASIGSYTLNNFALKRTNPSMVAIYIFIQPVVSAITGYYLLREKSSAPAWR